MMNLQTILQELVPLTSLISATISIAVLGLILKLTATIKAVQEERIKVIDERLQKTKDDLERTEKWYERDVKQLKDRLKGLLDDENITIDSLFKSLGSTEDLKADIREAITTTFNEMRALQDKVQEQHGEIEDPNWYIQMAKAATANGNWLEAAQYYDSFLKFDGDDWEVHFLRGVAYINSRLSDDSNLRALRSYNEAIALAPNDVNKNTIARLYTYRSAALKRLSRVDEAESSLLLAQKWATDEYEINDNLYNLACVYALKNEKEKMLNHLQQITSSRFRRMAINKHYFDDYRKDHDFKKLMT